MDTTLLQIITSIFQAIGITSVIFGAIVMAYGFGGSEGLERGWNSRKKQGLVMMFSGAILFALNATAKALTVDFDTALACKSLPFVGKYAPPLALIVSFIGIAEFALHSLSDKFGDRIIGIRLIVAGMMIAPIGKLIDLIFPV